MNQANVNPIPAPVVFPTAGVPAPAMPAPGMGVPAMPAPVMPAAMNVGAAGNNNSTAFAVIGYIAEQKNAIKKGSIDTKKAKEEYKKLYAQEGVQLAKGGPRVEIKSDGTAGTDSIEITDKFSMKVFRTYFKDAYDRVKALPTYQIDMSEGKVKYYIIKFFNTDLFSSSTVSISNKNAGDSTIVVSNDELKQFLASTSKPYVYIVAGGDATKQIGYVVPYAHEVTVKDRKTNQSVKKTKIDIKIYSIQGQKAGIRDLAWDTSSNTENDKVPYIVLKNNVTASTYTDVNATPEGNVTNLERFSKSFPAQNASELPARKVINKGDFASEKAYKEAKKAEFCAYNESYKTLGISPTIWDSLKKGGSSGGGASRKTEFDLIEMGNTAIDQYLKSKKGAN